MSGHESPQHPSPDSSAPRSESADKPSRALHPSADRLPDPRFPDPRPTDPAAPIEPLSESSASALPAEAPSSFTPRGLTADGTLKSGRLAGLSLSAAIITLSWPVLAESFLNALVGLTDTVLSTSISVAATDAVSGAAYVIWFMGLVVQSLGLGATALISRSVGAQRLGVANAALGQSVILALILGSVSGGLVALSTPIAANLLSMTGDTEKTFTTFMHVACVGGPGMALLFTLIAAARGAGDNFRPLLSMVIVNLTNIVASWALSGIDLTRAAPTELDPLARHVILTNPFSFDLGVAGIAWGTVLSYVIGAAFMTVVLVRGTGGVRLRLKRLRPHLHTAKRVIRVAFPNFLEMLGMWLGNFAVVLIVGWLGVTGNAAVGSAQGGTLGAHMVAIRIEAFSFLPGFAFGAAAATLVGQYLGAGSPSMAAKACYRCAWMAAALMGFAGIILMTLGEPIVALLSAQPEHQQTVPPLLFIAGCVQIPFGLSIVFRSALRGAGDTKSAMWITWITTYFVRMPLAWLLSGANIPMPGFAHGFWTEGVLHNPWPYDWGLTGLWIGLCAEIVIRAAIFAWRFSGGAWKKTRV